MWLMQNGMAEPGQRRRRLDRLPATCSASRPWPTSGPRWPRRRRRKIDAGSDRSLLRHQAADRPLLRRTHPARRRRPPDQAEDRRRGADGDAGRGVLMSLNVLNVPEPDFMQEEEITLFSDSVGKWIDEHAPPEAVQSWIANSTVPRELWNDAGEAGLLGLSMPEEDGGMGGDYRHEVVLMRQLGWKGADHFGISLHNAIVMPYIWHYGTEEQKQRWLPRLATGELVGAIAMTEPGAGSDLQGVKTTAIKSGNGYVVNGSKTFITNGQLANFIIVVAKTDPTAGREGHVPDRGRDRRRRRLRARPQPAQDRHGGQRHLRAVLQRRPGSRRQHHRRRRGPGLHPADAAAAAGAAEHRRPGRRRRRARARGDPRLRQGAARPSASRSSTSRTPSSNWPRSRPS